MTAMIKCIAMTRGRVPPISIVPSFLGFGRTALASNTMARSSLRAASRLSTTARFAAVTINASEQTFKMASWVSQSFESLYEPYTQHHGGGVLRAHQRQAVAEPGVPQRAWDPSCLSGRGA
jgi:hypothetical protein